VLSLIFFYAGTGAYAADRREGKLLLLAIDRVGWEDIYTARMPNLDRLLENGSIGLMTTNTAGRLTQKNAYITIGSGARLEGAAKSALGFSEYENYMGERAGDIYRQITGRTPVKDSLVNLGVEQVKRQNARRPYMVNIGALGQVLRKNGLIVALIGNSDIPQNPRRFMTSMLMDEFGVVPMGETGEKLLKKNHERPFGISTDYMEKLNALERYWDKADLLAIEFGDTSRAEEFATSADERVTELHRKKALEEIDLFLGDALKKLNMEKDMVVIMTSLPPARDLRINNRLSPVIISGAGINNGFVTSASTRRTGIVTNLDIAAAILEFFGIQPLHGQGGASISTIETKGALQEIIRLNHSLVDLFNQRGRLIRAHVLIQIFALAAATFVILLNKKKGFYWINWLFIFIMLIPLSYMLMTPFQQGILWVSALTVIGISLLLATAVLWLFRNAVERIAAASLMIVLVILIDQWTNANLIKWSPMGYDVISGARFYGIGNEYMGVLVGAASTSAGALTQILEKRKCSAGWLAISLHAMVLLTIALPWLGANLGGASASFTAFGYWLILANRWRFNVKTIAAYATIFVLMVVGLFVFDSLRQPDVQSHMGQTAQLVSQGGLIELVDIAYRKISMNLRLFGYTIWTNLVLVSLLSVGILFYRPVGILKDVINKYRAATNGIAAATAGSLAALVANDSGVVAAATSMAYVVFPLILLVTERLGESYGN
jgi:hypothetical protein